jgi:hypothetical protein
MMIRTRHKTAELVVRDHVSVAKDATLNAIMLRRNTAIFAKIGNVESVTIMKSALTTLALLIMQDMMVQTINANVIQRTVDQTRIMNASHATQDVINVTRETSATLQTVQSA